MSIAIKTGRNTQYRLEAARPFGSWNLGFLWSLEFGVWSFVSQSAPGIGSPAT